MLPRAAHADLDSAIKGKSSRAHWVWTTASICLHSLVIGCLLTCPPSVDRRRVLFTLIVLSEHFRLMIHLDSVNLNESPTSFLCFNAIHHNAVRRQACSIVLLERFLKT